MQRNRLHYSVYYENTHYYLYKKKIKKSVQFLEVAICRGYRL